MPLTIWWAQIPPPDPTLVTISTGLRRAVELQSLSLPDGLVAVRSGLVIWALAMAALAVLAFLAQGPRGFFGQLGDFGGHARFVGAAGRRLRNAFRLIVALLVVLVLAWTTTQSVEFLSGPSVMGLEPRGLIDVKALLKPGGGSDRAWELGVTEAIGPVRDLGGLGDLVVLLIIAGVAAFQFAADHSGGRGRLDRDGPGAWASVAWGAAGLYVLWRFAAIVGRRDGVPLAGCLPGEMVVIPLLMIFADGLLLAWILAELRGADFPDDDRPFLDARGALMLFPLAAFASVLIAPTRVMAHAYWLGKDQLKFLITEVNLLEFAMIAQGVTLPLVCVLGVVAWGRGPWMNLPLGWWRLMKAEGARILFWTAIVSVVAGAWVGVAEGLFLAMPPRTWTLAAADSYAQYGSILIGLWMVAGYVELGRRALPTARVALVEATAEARDGAGPAESLESTAGSPQPSRSA